MSDLPIESQVPASAPAGESALAATTQPVQAAISGEPAPLSGGPAEIPAEAIAVNPHQPRRQFNEAGLQALAASIKSTGLVQPIIVRRLPSAEPGTAPRYELIAGERRWRAARLAGLTTLPAIVREVDGFTQAQMALIENIQREDLNPMDRALAYRALMDQLGLTQAELAIRLGEERPTVANYLRLLELAEPVKELIRDGKLSLGHAKVLAGVTDPSQQAELAGRVVTQDLSVRNLERVVESASPEEQPEKAPPAPSAHLRDLERNMTSHLGLRVQLRAAAGKGKGKVIIHYSSLDQFDVLLERLGVKAD